MSSRAESFVGQELGGEIGAAAHMHGGVFGAGALGVVALLEIAGVVEEHRQQPELKVAPSQPRPRAGTVAPAQQPGHAQSPLERMLEIMVAGVDGLIIGVVAGETFAGPAEHTRDKATAAPRKDSDIGRLDFQLNRRKVFGSNRLIHRQNNTSRMPGMHAF